MNNAVETLKEVRARYANALLRVQEEIGLLEEKASSVKAKLDALDEVIREVGSSDGETTPALASMGKYSKSSLTEAILDVVNVWGSPPGLLIPEIIKKLESEGFKSKAKKLYASAYSVASRLVESERISEGTKDGKRSFMRKPKDK